MGWLGFGTRSGLDVASGCRLAGRRCSGCGMQGYGSPAASKGRETHWNGDMVGFGSGVTCPAVPESVRGRGSPGGPGHGDRAGDGQVPLGAFVFADPKRAMLPVLVEEFLGGR